MTVFHKEDNGTCSVNLNVGFLRASWFFLLRVLRRLTKLRPWLTMLVIRRILLQFKYSNMSHGDPLLREETLDSIQNLTSDILSLFEQTNMVVADWQEARDKGKGRSTVELLANGEEILERLKQVAVSDTSAMMLEEKNERGETAPCKTIYSGTRACVIQSYIEIFNSGSKCITIGNKFVFHLNLSDRHYFNLCQEELMNLLGVGEKKATNIIKYREQHPNPFQKLADVEIFNVSTKQIRKALGLK